MWFLKVFQPSRGIFLEWSLILEMEFISFLNQGFLFFLLISSFLFFNSSTHFSLTTESHFKKREEKEHTDDCLLRKFHLKRSRKNSQILILWRDWWKGWHAQMFTVLHGLLCFHIWGSPSIPEPPYRVQCWLDVKAVYSLQSQVCLESHFSSLLT